MGVETRITGILVGFGIVLVLAGCEPVPSVHPLFSEHDVVFEPALVGTWVMRENGDTLTFHQSGDKAYEATYTEENVAVKFEVHLIQLGKFLFLDAYPLEQPERFDLIPAHSFYRIRLEVSHAMEGDVLQIAFLDDDWLRKRIEEGEVNIAHERLGTDILLTASTKDLQMFVLKYAEDKEAFPDPEEFRRHN